MALILCFKVFIDQNNHDTEQDEYVKNQNSTVVSVVSIKLRKLKGNNLLLWPTHITSMYFMDLTQVSNDK